MQSAKRNIFIVCFHTFAKHRNTEPAHLNLRLFLLPFFLVFRMPTSSSRLSNRLRSINNQSFVTLNQRNTVIKSKIRNFKSVAISKIFTVCIDVSKCIDCLSFSMELTFLNFPKYLGLRLTIT